MFAAADCKMPSLKVEPWPESHTLLCVMAPMMMHLDIFFFYLRGDPFHA